MTAVERAAPEPCVVCKKAVQPGQLWIPRRSGPTHVYCDPPARLDVERVTQAARTR